MIYVKEENKLKANLIYFKYSLNAAIFRFKSSFFEANIENEYNGFLHGVRTSLLIEILTALQLKS